MIRLLATVSLFVGGLAVFDFVTMQDFTVQEGTLRIRYAKFAELLITITPLLFAVALFSKTKAKLTGEWETLAADPKSGKIGRYAEGAINAGKPGDALEF